MWRRLAPTPRCRPTTCRRGAWPANTSPIGSDLAAKQLRRKGIIIPAGGGAPDTTAAVTGDSQIRASASHGPWANAQVAVDFGAWILNASKPARAIVLIPSALVTGENVKS